MTSHADPPGARLSFSRSSLSRSRTSSSLLFRARSSLRKPECTSWTTCPVRAGCGSDAGAPGSRHSEEGVAPPDERPDPTTPRGESIDTDDFFARSSCVSPIASVRAFTLAPKFVTLVAANERASAAACALPPSRADAGRELCCDDDGDRGVPVFAPLPVGVGE